MSGVGIKAIVSRAVEKVTPAMIRDMHELPKRLHDDINRLVNGEDISYEEDTYSDYRKTLDELARGWDPEQVQEMLEQFPGDFQVQASAVVVRSQEIIKAMLKDYPVTQYQTVTGSDPLPPSDTRKFRFMNVLSTIDNPECVPYWMQCGGLMQSQTKAMRAVYPTMSEFIDACLFNAITKAKAKNKNFQLTSHAEYGVKAWWGRPPIGDQALAKAQMVAKAGTAKKQVEAEQQANPPSRSRVSDSPDSTALEKAEAASG